MDSYTLEDVPPPRYAVESDDEDEYNPLPSVQPNQQPEVHVEFKSIYEIPSNQPLVFASGDAGVGWAKIVNLGEQQAGIYVNKRQVGLLFRPSWTSAAIVVSEAETRTRLPLFAMTAYTTAILGRLQPTCVAILDSYPTQLYISAQVISRENAPVRYLSVGKKTVTDPALELFAAPNLLQTTSASLLNELFLRSIREDPVRDGAAVILPSPKVPPPPPTTLDAKGVPGDISDTTWDRETLEKAHKWLFALLGQNVDGSSLRSPTESGMRPPAARITLGEIGEGSMYI